MYKRYKDTIYEVNEKGTIRNINTKKELKTHKKNGYLVVPLRIEGKSKNRYVHRVVAETFLEIPDYECEVNHKNSKRDDCRVENLEWVSREYNYQHSITNGNGSQRKPVKATNILTNEEFVFNSLWSGAKFVEQKRNKKLNTNHVCNNIKNNVFGKTKQAYGYVWVLI